MNIKKKIHNDVWKIIENEDVEKPSLNDWINVVFHLLLESDKFLVENAIELAENLKESYDKLIDSVEERILDGNGEVLQVLKNIDKYYQDKIHPLLNRIKKLKKRT